jgi:hypothetical protein
MTILLESIGRSLSPLMAETCSAVAGRLDLRRKLPTRRRRSSRVFVGPEADQQLQQAESSEKSFGFPAGSESSPCSK